MQPLKPDAASSPVAALAALATGYFLIMVDQGIMPVLTPHLPFGVGAAVWLTSVYLICTVVPMPVAGRLGDRFGQRRIFIAGIALYLGALLLAAASWSLASLVAARALQGLGCAAFLPQAFGMINRFVPNDRRGRVFAVWGVVGSVGSLLGPILGGILVGAGWRTAFAAQAAIALVGLVLALKFLPQLPVSPARIDALSTALSLAGLGALVYGIQFLAWAPAFIGAALLAVFLAIQARGGDDALVPVRLFSDGNFAAGTFGIATMGFAVASMFIPVMYWLQGVAGVASTSAGLLTAPMSLLAMALTPYAGELSDRVSPRVLSAVGFGFMAAGLGLAWWVMHTGAPALLFAAVTSLLGVGSAFVWAPNATTTMRFVPDQAAGAASGLYNTVRQVGSVLGVALVGAVLAGGDVSSTAAPAIVLPLTAMLLGLVSTAFLRRDVTAKTR
ncbi:MFS transporter [Corynebacterium sanguinis]|uniref:MFS transporter n=1 Tax=Corynebacterium sanguinis TaxID=2594913 RepID=UPI0021AE376F|nr:MFS transporter [Corynebacterium sanguinis]MCT1694149.1 MFS transporter [Corynebacterium sanguinis]MCT1713651.1 MFS transporter [Corynebacterium sanguinis]MCT2252175.1 MFS transporter [Corynebacterium sanguinis]